MVKPIFDNIVVKILENETTSKSGIILGKNDSEEVSIAIAINVGDGVDEDGVKIPMYVKANDKILINKKGRFVYTL